MADGKQQIFAGLLAACLLTGCMPGPESVEAAKPGPVVVTEPIVYRPGELDPDSPDYCDPYCRMKRREAADEQARHRAKMECLAHPRSARLYEQGIEPCTNY